MTRFTIVHGIALALTATAALAGPEARFPPGGPAPKALVGTWKTVLTPADAAKAPFQRFMPSADRRGKTLPWYLIILNTGVGKTPRVLGLRPGDESGPSIPFAVQGHLIHLECLDANAGLPIAGHDTFRWSLSGGTLRLKVVRLHCKNPDDGNRAVVLVSEPWKRVR
jgi:hypothetical protein